MGFAQDHLVPLVDEGLGNSAYLVDLGDGRALAIDASLDLRALRRAAADRGLTMAYAADTHLHADFVTGARQLAADQGAQILASAADDRGYAHRALGDGDEVDLGGLTLRALATPGHTDEHLSYVLLDGAVPLGVFTGGSLIVGAVARTDLVDPQRSRELAVAQYASVHRLAALPDQTAMWPTHGAGSFCSAPPGAERTSTIGAEKATNPLLAAPDAESFADLLIAGLGTFPKYFRRLADLNRAGPAVLSGPPAVPTLDAPGARRALGEGALVVDVRSVSSFAKAHIPGAVSIALRDQFATWLGWLVDPATPWIVVRDPDQDLDEVLWQALKIGQPAPVGQLTMSDWDGSVATLPLLPPDRITGRRVLDVRQEQEFVAGHLPGAHNAELGDLTDDTLGSLASEPSVVMCAHGQRGATGASLLLRSGAKDVAVLDGGPGEWAEATGQALQEGR